MCLTAPSSFDSVDSPDPGNELAAISRSDPGSSDAMSWGTLINPDKSPAPLLEQLCLGIATQLMPSFDASGTTEITPNRIATFYRKVGGNYDALFLGTKAQALSFIYQSLGCFHSLQPSPNPYESPCIPSLLPTGFVRWQTIQLLMDPDEHSQYLQNAVEMWDIVDAKGDIFPKDLPRDAFPAEPDAEMLQWHETVSKRLEQDYEKCQRQRQRGSPPNFTGYHYRFSGKDPLPDEEEFFSSAPRRSGSRHQSHFDTEKPSHRRHHNCRPSEERPSYHGRRPDPAFFARPDGGRSGMSSPRGPSPSSRMDHNGRSRGRDRPFWHGRRLSRDRNEPQESESESDSDDTIHEDEREPPPPPRQHSRRHNLSPPTPSSARRHSHDAYKRKPARDLSPHAPRRSHRGYEYEHPMSRTHKSHSDGATRNHHGHHSDDHSHSRSSGFKFRDFNFDGRRPHPNVAPDPQMYSHAPPPPPPRAVPRHRYNIDPYADDPRRASYGGGSRPGSGSSSERPRAYSNAAYTTRGPRYPSPHRGSGKRYAPMKHAEDLGYTHSRRGPPIYD
ncbi:uncharacterized protein N7483_005414 [Penicillium malachiteum]|uniref:uncharacterized protein n=1 Tax=Penicillium malachiteum TaxID=1324776 RepID=UPI0025476468|nr:uncharacterized protein N7483_005414 [Penicillium malachiteum]KAJ5730906.1 hypothetical protein N7483_005414 [Penicillium malachiteum]